MIENWKTTCLGLALLVVAGLKSVSTGIIDTQDIASGLAALGLRGIMATPEVLGAINPVHATEFVTEHGFGAFLLLGAVVLAVTGAEALYADMGHFGRKPIRMAWFWLVFPCLLLNYLGQGALVLRDPSAVANPFYLLAPRPLLYPLIGVATAAAVIASQALISGAFSLTQQCVQLGYSPRVTGREIRLPETFDELLRVADRDLGCGSDACMI